MQARIKVSALMVGVFLLSLIGPRIGRVAAQSIETAVSPVSYSTQQGSAGGQAVSVLSVMDQSGTEDNSSKYISFTTPASVYSGSQIFQLPSGVAKTSIATMKLAVNYKGPLSTAQKWSWSMYNFSKKIWSPVGTNAAVSSNTSWNRLEFSVVAPANYISTTGEIRVLLRSSNATGDARVDYEAILFTTASSPTPTAVPPTATPFPSSTPTMVFTATPSPTATLPALAGLYYVSAQGNDSNPGTQAQPWRTIQKAANTATAGNTVLVQAGDYPERVTLNRSGSAASPIRFEAQGTVVMRGFTVSANYVTIRGFEITNTPDDSQNGMGIWVKGSGCLLENNYIHYATRGGILLYAEPGYETLTANCIVRNNRLYQNSQFGINVRGRNHLIEGNEIWGTIQYHPGWINSPSYVDADGIRFHGSGHIFRGNYIHDILYAAVENNAPHIDCFQTFQALPYQEAASNVTLERNRCENAQSQSSLEVGKGFMLQNANGIVIRNNIIHAYVGVKADTGCNNLTVLNNTFTGNVSLTTAHSPSGISLANVATAVIKNNIFFNLPGHIIYLTNSVVSAGKNLAYRNDGQALWNSNTYSHVNDLWGVNPMFASATDFRLAAGSPAIDSGVSVSVVDDFDGTPRPRGAGHDIGAFER